jgi:hypothetical protein
LHPNKYGFNQAANYTTIAFSPDSADRLCTAAEKPGSKIGLIVGVVAAAALLAALAILCAIFHHRIKQFVAKVWQGSGGHHNEHGTVKENPTFVNAHENKTNPLFL